MASAGLPTSFEAMPHPSEGDDELAWLWRARAAGVEIAPMAVVPPEVETTFYRLNNLPARIRRLFVGVDLADPDEDDLEDLAPEAEALVLGHALLEEVVEAFYAATDGLARTLTVRRTGSEGRGAPRGRPALLALKRCWADDWLPGSLLERLQRGWGLAPRPRAVLVHDAAVRETVLAEDHGAGSGGARAWIDVSGRVARLARDPRS
jgi:hypothetical protein